MRVGMLSNALLRNVRAVSAIGLHTEGWTVEQSRKLFLEQAFQDEASAEQQAVRGTFDPMYLAYTVGKLAIVKLRKDVEDSARSIEEAARSFETSVTREVNAAQEELRALETLADPTKELVDQSTESTGSAPAPASPSPDSSPATPAKSPS